MFICYTEQYVGKVFFSVLESVSAAVVVFNAVFLSRMQKSSAAPHVQERFDKLAFY